MAFYVGKYLIDGDTIEPLHTGAWFMPDAPKQHMAETSNVEELQVLPTDMDSIPTQIQFGACAWTDDEGFSADHDAFDTFYVADQKFYLRGFSVGTGHYDTFYVGGTGFYVRSFSAGTGHYDTFYVRDAAFYVQGFSPVDFFYPIAEDC